MAYHRRTYWPALMVLLGSASHADLVSDLADLSARAEYGFYALVALTRNADRVCHVALGALAVYGERLREPVDALLYRLHAQGRGDDSPYCAWPGSRVTRTPQPMNASGTLPRG